MLLASILDACISVPSSYHLITSIILVDRLMTAMQACDLLRSRMLASLSANTLQGKMQNLIQASMVVERTSCHTYIASHHQKLVSGVAASLLTLALTAPPGPSALPHNFVIALINKQRDALSVSSRCSHFSGATKTPSISLFQQQCTPYTGQHLKDWRDRLKTELESQSFYQRDSIVRSVAQICQDLETRCKTVEAPLRREQEKSKELEKQVAQLNKQILSLESHIADDKFHLEGLEDERERINDEKDRVSASLKELKAEFSEANIKATEALRKAQGDYNAKELELQAQILRHEQTTAAYDAEHEKLNGMLLQLKEDQERQKLERLSLDEQYEQLQIRLSDAEQRLKEEQNTTTQQADEISRLQNRTFDIDNQLQSTEEELEMVNAKLSDLQVSFEEMKQASNEKLRELEVKHMNEMEGATVKMEENQRNLNAQLQAMVQNAERERQVYDDTRRNLQDLQTSIPLMEIRIQELIDICSEQGEELDELRTLRRNVLASMGLASQKSLAIRSTAPNEVVDQRAPREHRRRKSAIQTQKVAPNAPLDSQGITTNAAMEHIANASFASSDSHSSQGGGPSPKRPKPRPSFKIPTMHTPYTQGLTSRSGTVSPSMRTALRQMSPNSRHNTANIATTENEEDHEHDVCSMRTKRNSLLDAKQKSFDIAKDFLTATPLTPGNFMAGTGRVPEEDDGTMADL